MRWQFRLLELFDAMLYPFEFPFGFKAAAELRGIHFGTGRLPQTPQQRTEHEALSKVLECILADFELVSPPALGCPMINASLASVYRGVTHFHVTTAIPAHPSPRTLIPAHPPL